MERATLANLCDELLLATSTFQVENYKTIMLAASAKYLIDIIFCCLFSKHYDTIMNLNELYLSIRKENMWYILEDSKKNDKVNRNPKKTDH